MKNLVLSLFLIFSFAVQGFGSDIELSMQKANKCFKNSEEFNKCLDDLLAMCYNNDSCSDCFALISVYITLMSSDSYNSADNNTYQEIITHVLNDKSDTCPDLMRDTVMLINYYSGKNKK